jgi:peptidoglycan/LPS O-acetylase OafA/YrhL
MEVLVRLGLGLGGLAVFLLMAVGDARQVRDRLAVPVAWLLVMTGATVFAGLVHLALTPQHWREDPRYGLFFLAAGIVQLVQAVRISRPELVSMTTVGLVAVNAVLIATYVATRIIPPLGADSPEAFDSLGIVTVAAEALAAVVGVVLTWRLVRAPGATERPGTGSSCPYPHAPAGGNGTHTGL